MPHLFQRFLATICFLIVSSGGAHAQLSDKQLAEKFAPRIHFHSGEKYFPSSVEWYLERCQLVTMGKKGRSFGFGPLKKKVTKDKLNIIKEAPLTTADIAGKDKDHFVDAMKNKDTYKGTPSGPGSEAPVYAAVFRKPAGNGTPATAAIQYWTFYPYNGPFQGMSLFGKDLVGFHEGDIEVLIVYVKEATPDNWEITRIYFSRHGREFGEPMDPNDAAMEYVEDGHPVALAARGGHGLYPSNVSARWTRKAADVVNKGPKYWDTWKNVVMITESTDWNTFKGRFGLAGGGPTGPSSKLLWERTKAGEGDPKINRETVLRTLDAGTGDGSKKKRKLFKLGISSHYKDICFELQNAEGQIVSGTNYKIMERKRFKRKNQEWYRVENGRQCMKSRVVKHKELKGVFVEITKRGPKAIGPLKLVVKGIEPF